MGLKRQPMERLARMLASFAALVAIALAFGTPASASAESTAQRADRIMREVTFQMTHAPSADGLDQDQVPLQQLIQRYDRGERLYLRCGPQALVAQAILARNGITSRIVNTLAAQGAWDFEGDGHTFLEVWIGNRWIAYDPDANRQFVDARGRAIGALRATYTRPFHFRYIASDPYLEAYYYPYEELDRAIDHAMGIPAIQTSGSAGNLQFSYHVGPALRERIKDYGLSNWTWVGKKQWGRITQGEYRPAGTIRMAGSRWGKLSR
jgi:hypothetical protein